MLFRSFYMFVTLMFLSVWTGSTSFIIIALVGLPLLFYYLRRKALQEVDEILSIRRDALSSICLSTKDYCRRYAKHAVVIVSTLYFMYKLYNRTKENSQDTSSYLKHSTKIFKVLVPGPHSKYHKPLPDEKDYKEGYTRLPPRMIGPSPTTTSDDLQAMLSKHLRLVTVKSSTGRLTTVTGIMVTGNILQIPSHVLPKTRPIDIETTTCPGVPSASTKDQRLGDEHIHVNDEKDIAHIHLPSAPSSKNLVPFYPPSEINFDSRPTVLVGKTYENETFESKQAIRPYVNTHGKRELCYSNCTEKDGFFYGTKLTGDIIRIKNPYTCELDFPTYNGLCGSLYVDREKAIIYGMHVAGYASGKLATAWLTTIHQEDINAAISKLKQTSPQMILAPRSDLKLNTEGTNYTIENSPPLFTLPEGKGEEAIVTYHGRVKKDGQDLIESAKTPYMKTPFLGVKEEFGDAKSIPPKFPNDVNKGLKTLNKLVSPVQHYEHDTLKKAVDDFNEHLLGVVNEHFDEAKELLKIYTQQEALDGINAAGFGGMPNSTSAGHPYNCSKKKILKSDPLDPTKPKIPREFDDTLYDVQKDIDEIYQLWEQGRRSETIFKASSKVNELLPRKKAEEKVRKFYGSNVAFLTNSRRVLSGLVVFMRNHQKDFECFVGMNPMSKDWTEFEKYITRFGGERMIAGDFSGFDTTMAQQVSTSAAAIIVNLYRAVGVPEDDLAILGACLSDICNPNVLFMGDLYNFANMNPSGQPITVQLNSLVNSIMMRYVFYKLYPKSITPFKTHVQLAVYGDDNLMDIAKTAPRFTHTNCQKEFAEIGIGYTMADKDAESRPYITIKEASFLKRGFRQLSDIEGMGAPIEEESIIKKYHFVKKPGESPLCAPEQFSAYCDGAFREAYLHGREYYEGFVYKIKRIVALNESLQHRIAFLHYDEMTNVLKPYYRDDYKGGDPHLFSEGMDGYDEFSC